MTLTFGALGWARPDIGVARWIDQGMPRDGRALDVLATWWGEDAVGVCHWNAHSGTVTQHGARLAGTLGHRLPAAPPLAPSTARRRVESMMTDRGGYDVGHLHHVVDHLLGEEPGFEQLLASTSPTRYLDAGGEQGHLVLRTAYHGWYRMLNEAGKALPQRHGGRSWVIEVVVDSLGSLGSYRRSPVTNRWFSGPHDVHLLGWPVDRHTSTRDGHRQRPGDITSPPTAVDAPPRTSNDPQETPVATIAPEHRVVLINISRSGPAAGGDQGALYQATREWWTVGAIRTVPGPAAPELALAVIKGQVVAAYRIQGWHQRQDGRRAFDGERNDLYVGTDVSKFFPPGAQNPLRYVNCSASTPPAGTEPIPGERAEPRHRPRQRPMAVDVAAIAEALDAEPLAHLMFGHRELFHTNLMAWFFRALPEAADRVFATGLRPGPGTERRVRREHQHLDLHMTWPGRERLIVENKVFSIYDNEQLYDYADLVATWDGPARLVLLSTTPPDGDPLWSGDGLQHGHEARLTPWAHLSYVELADRIDAALTGARETYEVQTMRHYATLARLLHQLMNVTRVHSLEERVALPDDVIAQITDSRLLQAVTRSRARHVANLVEQVAREHGADGRASSAFAAAGLLVDWRVDVADEDGNVVEVGWQLQADALRRFITVGHLAGTSPTSMAARYAYAKAHPQWFDFEPLDGVLGTGGTPSAPAITVNKPHGLNKYDSDFVYRYKKTPEVSVAQLVAISETLMRTVTA